MLPLDAGQITGQITDLSNCFNINSVVRQEAEGVLVARKEGVTEYKFLLEGAGVDRGLAEALAESLADWLDSDIETLPAGAEDGFYSRLDPAYRTAGTLLLDISELRAVAHHSREIVAAIEPFICALPTPSLTEFNVNTLAPHHALMISAALGGGIPPERIATAIAERGALGFDAPGVFWRKDVFEDLDEETIEALTSRSRLWSRFYRMEAEVAYAGTTLPARALLELDAQGSTRLIFREFGEVR